ncbi:uncharacterized protein isoform X2 [Choristoneura fumiferana]|uniref:uncharacterized protein isoform X2 n=1 Tax=Choristoneura fumiferana TaxID=7141 RepID=UPI003D15BBD7
MEHIRQYDWCTSTPDTINFLTEQELDSCVTEKILQNKFFNPLVSSDSEDEPRKPGLDWDTIFHRRNNEAGCHRIYVPGLRPSPPYPRVSSLSQQHHMHCLRVLCARRQTILPDEFMPRPIKMDYQVFEEVKEIYAKEQQEYMEWAKTLWTNGNCIRALRPKPQIESVYEAEFKMRAHQMKGYPTTFEVVAQLALESNGEFEMVPLKDFINVNVSNLPKAMYPEKIQKRMTVVRPCSLPEPCEEHPVRFVLPGEKTISILPLTEVHRELAQYAADNGVQFVCGEGALRCLVQRRGWALPVSVVDVPTPDGDSCQVIILGSEFSNKRENVLIRTFRAYRHLLEVALVPPSEMSKMLKAIDKEPQAVQNDNDAQKAFDNSWMEACSDDEDNLFIDFDDDAPLSSIAAKNKSKDSDTQSDVDMRQVDDGKPNKTKEKHDKNKSSDGYGIYSCTCKDSLFERPPPRSFRKWQIRNNKTSEHYNVMVHCAHKFRGSSGEVLLEPIPEYQSDLGASKQSEDRIRSLALSLALRQNASVINVRIDAQSGDVITIDELQHQEFSEYYGDQTGVVANCVHTALNQLQGLMPGHYVMAHEPSHGDNALLYAPRNTGREQKLVLSYDCSTLAEDDEAKSVRTPPLITNELLPYHKFRKTLPCAFTIYPNSVIKEQKKPVVRQKTPPQAIKWPKKRGGKATRGH